MNTDARAAKGVALFATLVGIYNWVGQGASLLDVAIVLFAAILILGIEHDTKDTPPVPVEVNETDDSRHTFLRETSIPLKQGFFGLVGADFF